MFRLLKGLGAALVMVSSIGQASATSAEIFPVTLTGGPELFLISYSSVGAFNLSGLSLELGSPGTPPNQFISQGPSSAFFAFTGTSLANNLSGSGTLSETFAAPAGSYTYAFNSNATGSVNFSVSPVPLPASLPLFVMALLGLGMLGYRSTRRTKAENSDFALCN